VPKLWEHTVDAHRHAVRHATLEATAALVAERGLPGVTMSEIARRTGIGRATLYKYFPDVESIVHAWHERQVAEHLERLVAVRAQGGDVQQRLVAVLEAYALLAGQFHGRQIAAVLHRANHVIHAQHQVHDLIAGLLAEGVIAGFVRDDVPPTELAAYCLHALEASATLENPDAVSRLVGVTLAGLTAR
jgi:AcrR family transcriptional regulator